MSRKNKNARSVIHTQRNFSRNFISQPVQGQLTMNEVPVPATGTLARESERCDVPPTHLIGLNIVERSLRLPVPELDHATSGQILWDIHRVVDGVSNALVHPPRMFMYLILFRLVLFDHRTHDALWHHERHTACYPRPLHFLLG